MPESRQSTSTPLSRSSLSSITTADTSGLHSFQVRFSIDPTESSKESRRSTSPKRSYDTNTAKTSKVKQSTSRPALKNSLQKLRILGPLVESKIAEHHDQASTSQKEKTSSSKFDAVTYFKKLASVSKQIQAGIKSSHLGVQGIGTKVEQQTLNITRSGIIDHERNIDPQLNNEKRSWPVVLRSILKLHTTGKIKMMVHVADGNPADGNSPGYYLRPVFHCERCHKYFIHHADIDTTCQQLSMPILGPWFVVGPATVKFVLSVSKIIEEQSDTTRSHALSGCPSRRPLHKLAAADIMAGGPPLARGLRFPKKFPEHGLTNLNLRLNQDSDYINFRAVESKLFNIEEVIDTPSMEALKELAFRGVKSFEDKRKKSLYADRKRVDVSGELSHRKYRGLPDIIKHFLTPYGREELRTSMSSELPEISVDPTELYSGVAINKLVELRDELSRISSDTLLSDKLITLTEDLLHAEQQMTETHDKILKASTASPTAFLAPSSIKESSFNKASTSDSSKSMAELKRPQKSPTGGALLDPNSQRPATLSVGIEGTSLEYSSKSQHSLGIKSENQESVSRRVSFSPDIPPYSVASANFDELGTDFLTVTRPGNRHGSHITIMSDLPRLSTSFQSKSSQKLDLDEEVLLVAKKNIHLTPLVKNDADLKRRSRGSNVRVSPDDIRDLLTQHGLDDRPTILQAMKFAKSMAYSEQRPTKALDKSQLNKFIELVKFMKPKPAHLSRVGRSSSMGNILHTSRGKDMSTWFESYAQTETARRNSETDLPERRMFYEHKDLVEESHSPDASTKKTEEINKLKSFGRREFRSFSLTNVSSETKSKFDGFDLAKRPITVKVEQPPDQEEITPQKVDSAIIHRKKKLSDIKQQLVDMAKMLEAKRERKVSSLSFNASQASTRTSQKLSSSSIKSAITDHADAPHGELIAKKRESEVEAAQVPTLQHVPLDEVTAAMLLTDVIDIALRNKPRDSLKIDSKELESLLSEKILQLQSAEGADARLKEVKLLLINKIVSSQLTKKRDKFRAMSDASESEERAASFGHAIMPQHTNPTEADALEDTTQQVLFLNRELTRQEAEEFELIADICKMAADGILGAEEALRCIAEIGTNLGLNKLTSANYESLQAATEHVYDTVFRQLEQKDEDIKRSIIPLELMWQLHADYRSSDKDPSDVVDGDVTAMSLLESKLASKNFKAKRERIIKQIEAENHTQTQCQEVSGLNRSILQGLEKASVQLRKEIKGDKLQTKLSSFQSFLANKTLELQSTEELREAHKDINIPARVQHFSSLHPTLRDHLSDNRFISLVTTLNRDVNQLSEEEMQAFVDLHQLIQQRADAENDGVVTSLKMLTIKGVAELAAQAARDERTSQLDSEEVTSFAYDRLAKRRLVDTLKDSIVRKAQTLSSSSAADTLLKHLLAMSKFKYMISVMGVNPKRLNDDAYVQQMVKFFNFLYSWDIDPTTLRAHTLWELKTFKSLTLKMFDESNLSDGNEPEMFEFWRLLQAMGKQIAMLPKKVLQHYFEFYKNLEKYGLSVSYCESADHKELHDWYNFHTRLRTEYSRIMDVDKLSTAELKDLKDISDIHTKFNVFSEEDLSESQLEEWIRFAEAYKENNKDVLKELSHDTKEEKIRNLSSDLSAIKDLSKESLLEDLKSEEEVDSNLSKMIEEKKHSDAPTVISTINEPTTHLEHSIADSDYSRLRDNTSIANSDVASERIEFKSTQEISIDELEASPMVSYFQEALNIPAKELTEKIANPKAINKLNKMFNIISFIGKNLTKTEADRFNQGLQLVLQDSNLEDIVSFTENDLLKIAKDVLPEAKLEALGSRVDTRTILPEKDHTP